MLRLFSSVSVWPGIKANMLGITIDTTAIRSIVEFMPAMLLEIFCSLYLKPPKMILSPRTKSRFPMIEPVIEALTSSVKPLLIAIKAMISSAAFPNVAFSNPPM